jgi:AcrR family transcriptional regulator
MSTTPGLRERKKAKTRAAIQTHALRLFAAQGYEATTIEQIAEAAEISPSTFFRYFPTKEDVVVEDDYDPLIIAAFQAAGTAERPLARLRAAVREVLATIGDDEQREILERTRLIFAVPALRARSMQNMLSTMDLLAEALSRDAGLPAADRRVRIFTGAILGAWMSVLIRWAAADGEERLADVLDEAMATLEEGLDGPLARE